MLNAGSKNLIVGFNTGKDGIVLKKKINLSCLVKIRNQLSLGVPIGGMLLMELTHSIYFNSMTNSTNIQVNL